MYSVIIHRRAAHYLQKLTPDQQIRIKRALNEISHDPFGLPEIKNMLGDWAGYKRIKVASIRIIFWVDKVKKIVY
jgi:mRNA interferase RelE/StbE